MLRREKRSLLVCALLSLSLLYTAIWPVVPGRLLCAEMKSPSRERPGKADRYTAATGGRAGVMRIGKRAWAE